MLVLEEIVDSLYKHVQDPTNTTEQVYQKLVKDLEIEDSALYKDSIQYSKEKAIECIRKYRQKGEGLEAAAKTLHDLLEIEPKLDYNFFRDREDLFRS